MEGALRVGAGAMNEEQIEDEVTANVSDVLVYVCVHANAYWWCLSYDLMHLQHTLFLTLSHILPPL